MSTAEQPQSGQGPNVEQFSTVTENVTPCYARLGDYQFCFDKRPNADMQLKLMEIANADKRDPQSVMVVRDMLQAMLADPSRTEEILQLADVGEVARIINWAVRQMSERPTTGRLDSSQSPPETTSDTGSSEPDSPVRPLEG